jgi:hypothetical protein
MGFNCKKENEMWSLEQYGAENAKRCGITVEANYAEGRRGQNIAVGEDGRLIYAAEKELISVAVTETAAPTFDCIPASNL